MYSNVLKIVSSILHSKNCVHLYMACSASNCLWQTYWSTQCLCVCMYVNVMKTSCEWKEDLKIVGIMNHAAGQWVSGILEVAVIIVTIILLFCSLLLPSPAGVLTSPRLSTTNFSPATWLVPINFPSILPSLTLLLSWCALKDGTCTLSHYLSKKVAINKMEHPRRAMTSARTWSEPKISISHSFTRCHWETLGVMWLAYMSMNKIIGMCEYMHYI